MYKKEHVVHLLQKIKQTLERIIANSKEIDSYQYYYLTPAGMERLESTCMLLIAVGESIKGIDKLTNKELLTQFPEIDWKGAMGIRDIYYHKRRTGYNLKSIEEGKKEWKNRTESNERGNRVNPLLNSLAKMSASDTENSLIAYTAFSGHRTKKNGL